MPGNDGICNNEHDLTPDNVIFENAYKSIDFNDISLSLNLEKAIFKGIIIKTNGITNKNRIKHTLPDVNRCCQIDATEEVHYDGIDKIPRDSCDIPKSEFFDKYVSPRKPVMLNGCQDTWAARNWTFKGNTALFGLHIIRYKCIIS